MIRNLNLTSTTSGRVTSRLSSANLERRHIHRVLAIYRWWKGETILPILKRFIFFFCLFESLTSCFALLSLEYQVTNKYITHKKKKTQKPKNQKNKKQKPKTKNQKTKNKKQKTKNKKQKTKNKKQKTKKTYPACSSLPICTSLGFIASSTLIWGVWNMIISKYWAN